MRRFLRAVLVGALLVVAAGCSGSGRSSDLLGVELRTLSGEQTSLGAANDGVVVVNFWASYCKPCIREMPALQRVADAYPRVRFIGVNALDDPELAQQLVAETGVRYEIWLDERGEAMRAAGVRSLPGTLILSDGEVVFSKLGEITESELRDAVSGAENSR